MLKKSNFKCNGLMLSWKTLIIKQNIWKAKNTFTAFLHPWLIFFLFLFLLFVCLLFFFFTRGNIYIYIFSQQDVASKKYFLLLWIIIYQIRRDNHFSGRTYYPTNWFRQCKSTQSFKIKMNFNWCWLSLKTIALSLL